MECLPITPYRCASDGSDCPTSLPSNEISPVVASSGRKIRPATARHHAHPVDYMHLARALPSSFKPERPGCRVPEKNLKKRSAFCCVWADGLQRVDMVTIGYFKSKELERKKMIRPELQKRCREKGTKHYFFSFHCWGG